MLASMRWLLCGEKKKRHLTFMTVQKKKIISVIVVKLLRKGFLSITVLFCNLREICNHFRPNGMHLCFKGLDPVPRQNIFGFGRVCHRFVLISMASRSRPTCSLAAPRTNVRKGQQPSVNLHFSVKGGGGRYDAALFKVLLLRRLKSVTITI